MIGDKYIYNTNKNKEVFKGRLNKKHKKSLSSITDLKNHQKNNSRENFLSPKSPGSDSFVILNNREVNKTNSFISNENDDKFNPCIVSVRHKHENKASIFSDFDKSGKENKTHLKIKKISIMNNTNGKDAFNDSFKQVIFSKNNNNYESEFGKTFILPDIDFNNKLIKERQKDFSKKFCKEKYSNSSLYEIKDSPYDKNKESKIFKNLDLNVNKNQIYKVMKY